MNYFKFLYERHQKRKLIRKLINDYNDLHEIMICAEMQKLEVEEFKFENLFESNLRFGACCLSAWKYNNQIFNKIWVIRHILDSEYSNYWCKPLWKCNSYLELDQNIQKRINILYIELNNPKI